MEKSPDGTYTNFGIANFGEIFVFCHSHACLPVGKRESRFRKIKSYRKREQLV